MGKKAKKAKKQYRAALARVGSQLLTQAERFKYDKTERATKYSDTQPRGYDGRWTAGEDARTGYAPRRGDIIHEHPGPAIHGHPGFREAAKPGLHAHRISPAGGYPPVARGSVDPVTGEQHVEAVPASEAAAVRARAQAGLDMSHSGTISDARPAIERYGTPEHEFYLRQMEQEEG